MSVTPTMHTTTIEIDTKSIPHGVMWQSWDGVTTLPEVTVTAYGTSQGVGTADELQMVPFTSPVCPPPVCATITDINKVVFSFPDHLKGTQLRLYMFVSCNNSQNEADYNNFRKFTLDPGTTWSASATIEKQTQPSWQPSLHKYVDELVYVTAYRLVKKTTTTTTTATTTTLTPTTACEASEPMSTAMILGWVAFALAVLALLMLAMMLINKNK